MTESPLDLPMTSFSKQLEIEKEQTISDSDTKADNLVCHWNKCLKVFADHPSLASHLSEDHVGWKKGGYSCEWDNCSRLGVKCHNRFALMMHLRIHTGEKPFECTIANCGQTFGRMDALIRHKRAEHGEPIPEKLMKPNSNLSSLVHSNSGHLNNNNIPKSKKSVNKRPASSSLDLLSKNKRIKIKKISDWSSEDESDDLPLSINDISVGSSKPLTLGSEYSRYRLAKAQLNYILRENEMLQEEYESAQKKLKRMRTERRVLLDAVMAAEQYKSEGEDDHIPAEDQIMD